MKGAGAQKERADLWVSGKCGRGFGPRPMTPVWSVGAHSADVLYCGLIKPMSEPNCMRQRLRLRSYSKQPPVAASHSPYDSGQRKSLVWGQCPLPAQEWQRAVL